MPSRRPFEQRFPLLVLVLQLFTISCVGIDHLPPPEGADLIFLVAVDDSGPHTLFRFRSDSDQSVSLPEGTELFYVGFDASELLSTFPELDPDRLDEITAGRPSEEFHGCVDYTGFVRSQKELEVLPETALVWHVDAGELVPAELEALPQISVRLPCLPIGCGTEPDVVVRPFGLDDPYLELGTSLRDGVEAQEADRQFFTMTPFGPDRLLVMTSSSSIFVATRGEAYDPSVASFSRSFELLENTDPERAWLLERLSSPLSSTTGNAIMAASLRDPTPAPGSPPIGPEDRGAIVSVHSGASGLSARVIWEESGTRVRSLETDGTRIIAGGKKFILAAESFAGPYDEFTLREDDTAAFVGLWSGPQIRHVALFDRAIYFGDVARAAGLDHMLLPPAVNPSAMFLSDRSGSVDAFIGYKRPGLRRINLETREDVEIPLFLPLEAGECFPEAVGDQCGVAVPGGNASLIGIGEMGDRLVIVTDDCPAIFFVDVRTGRSRMVWLGTSRVGLDMDSRIRSMVKTEQGFVLGGGKGRLQEFEIE